MTKGHQFKNDTLTMRRRVNTIQRVKALKAWVKTQDKCAERLKQAMLIFDQMINLYTTKDGSLQLFQEKEQKRIQKRAAEREKKKLLLKKQKEEQEEAEKKAKRLVANIKRSGSPVQQDEFSAPMVECVLGEEEERQRLEEATNRVRIKREPQSGASSQQPRLAMRIKREPGLAGEATSGQLVRVKKEPKEHAPLVRVKLERSLKRERPDPEEFGRITAVSGDVEMIEANGGVDVPAAVEMTIAAVDGGVALEESNEGVSRTSVIPADSVGEGGEGLGAERTPRMEVVEAAQGANVGEEATNDAITPVILNSTVGEIQGVENQAVEVNAAAELGTTDVEKPIETDKQETPSEGQPVETVVNGENELLEKEAGQDSVSVSNENVVPTVEEEVVDAITNVPNMDVEPPKEKDNEPLEKNQVENNCDENVQTTFANNANSIEEELGEWWKKSVTKEKSPQIPPLNEVLDTRKIGKVRLSPTNTPALTATKEPLPLDDDDEVVEIVNPQPVIVIDDEDETILIEDDEAAVSKEADQQEDVVMADAVEDPPVQEDEPSLVISSVVSTAVLEEEKEVDKEPTEEMLNEEESPGLETEVGEVGDRELEPMEAENVEGEVENEEPAGAMIEEPESELSPVNEEESIEPKEKETEAELEEQGRDSSPLTEKEPSEPEETEIAEQERADENEEPADAMLEDQESDSGLETEKKASDSEETEVIVPKLVKNGVKHNENDTDIPLETTEIATKDITNGHGDNLHAEQDREGQDDGTNSAKRLK